LGELDMKKEKPNSELNPVILLILGMIIVVKILNIMDTTR
jgi:hypothetical protein